MSIGERIRKRREAISMSRFDLAYTIRTSINQIYRYENDVNEPGASVLFKIAKALDVSTDYLLGMIETPIVREHEEAVVRKLLDSYMAGELEDVIKIVLTEMKERRKNEK